MKQTNDNKRVFLLFNEEDAHDLVVKYKNRWKRMLKIYGYKPEFRQWTTRTDVENPPWKHKKVPKGICKYAKRNDLLYVDYDGTVVPCCVHPRAGVYGNLLEDNASIILKNKNGFVDIISTIRHKMDVCGKCTKT